MTANQSYANRTHCERVLLVEAARMDTFTITDLINRAKAVGLHRNPNTIRRVVFNWERGLLLSASGPIRRGPALIERIGPRRPASVAQAWRWIEAEVAA